MKHEDIIKVVTAHANGKKIQTRLRNSGEEWYIIREPCWDFFHYEYRVARRNLGTRLWFWRSEPGSIVFILHPDGTFKGIFGPPWPTAGQISPDGVNWENYE